MLIAKVSTMDIVTFSHRAIEPFFSDSTAACISQDGRLVATAAGEDVCIVDVAQQEIQARIEGDGEPVSSLVMTPDGRFVGIFLQSQQLRVYDTTQSRVTKQWRLLAPVYMSRADPTSTLFAFGGSDGVVNVWDVEGGYVTHSLKGHGTTICALAFFGGHGSADWRLASGDIMGTVKVWDLVKRKCIATIREHTSAVRGLAFDTQGRLVTGGRDQIVVLYNDKMKPAKTFPVRHQVEAVGFVVVGGEACIFTAGSGSTLWVWDASGTLVGHLEKQLETSEELMVTDVMETGNGSSVGLWLVMSDQMLVEVGIFNGNKDADRENGTTTVGSDGLLQLPIISRLAGNHGTVADVCYAGPNLQYLAMATNSPALRIMNPDTPLSVQLCQSHTDLLNAVAVLSDGLWVATAGKDGKAVLWQWKDGEFAVHLTYVGHAGSVTAIGLSQAVAPPAFLVSGSDDLTVKKWKIPKNDTGEPVAVTLAEYTRRAHDKDINAVAVAPNDEFFGLASYDKTAKIWSTKTGDTVGLLKGHRRGLWDIQFSTHAPTVVTCGGDKTAKTWLLQDFTCTATMEGHTNAVQRARFVNNNQVATCGADGLIKLWTASGECVATLDNHENRIWALATKHEGLQMVSCDGDATITVWDDTSDAARAARDHQNSLRVEQEQQLANSIASHDYSGAFLLALTLDHPMRLYLVVRSSMENGPDTQLRLGLRELEDTIQKLSDSQLLVVMKRTRQWNINFRSFDVAQGLVRVILGSVPPSRLVAIPGMVAMVDAVVAYNQRHAARVDGLIENSYMLDHAVAGMGMH